MRRLVAFLVMCCFFVTSTALAATPKFSPSSKLAQEHLEQLSQPPADGPQPLDMPGDQTDGAQTAMVILAAAGLAFSIFVFVYNQSNKPD